MLSFIEIHLKICSPQEYRRPDTTHVDEIHTAIPAGEGGMPLIGCPRPKSHRTGGWSPWYESSTGSRVSKNHPTAPPDKEEVQATPNPPRERGNNPRISAAFCLFLTCMQRVCIHAVCDLCVEHYCVISSAFCLKTKFRPHVCQTMNSRLELGKHLTSHPSLTALLPCFPTTTTSPLCSPLSASFSFVPLHISRHIHVSLSISSCLFSNVSDLIIHS